MKKGTIIAVIALSLLAVSGAVLSGILFARNAELMRERDEYKQHLELSYQESLYQLSANVYNVESNLSKLSVSGDTASQITILSDLSRNCDNASEGLSQLPINTADTYKTQKFLSQVGDFSVNLRRKLVAGGKITEADEDNIEKMLKLNEELSEKIVSLTIDVGTDYKITDMPHPGKNPPPNYFGDSIRDMNGESLQYPELIYDGPFSDAIENKRAVQDLNNIIPVEEAQAKTEQAFSGMGDVTVTYLERADSDMSTYSFRVVAGGNEYYVQNCVCSGKIVLLSANVTAGEESKSDKDCRDIAEKFAVKLGYEDTLKAVWSSKEGKYCFVQLAPVIEGTVYYTDTIKVKVSADGTVCGFESFAYQCNAANRKTYKHKLSASEAAKNLKDGVEVTSIRKAVIPRHGGEVLTYEYICEYKGKEYYIYLNAETGAEENLLRVAGNAVM